MGKARGDLNLGQLCRERFAQQDPERMFNIGFSMRTGRVEAAHDFGKAVHNMLFNPSM